MNTHEELAHNLTSHREAATPSVKQRAVKAGVSDRTIVNITADGGSSPSIETVAKLAQALGVQVADLFVSNGREPHVTQQHSRLAHDVGRLIEDFLGASVEGQRRIAKLAFDEAHKS